MTIGSGVSIGDEIDFNSPPNAMKQAGEYSKFDGGVELGI
jgi:hypothetical protein